VGEPDPTMERLEDQIRWYSQRSGSNQRAFKIIKLAQIILAAAIPVLVNIQPDLRVVVAVFGAAIVVLEGAQQLCQFQQNWVDYRSTCEALKHEKFLYLAKAGPYADAKVPHALLAERVESLVSEQHARWVSTSQEQMPAADGDAKP